jgi:hypothetical protein
MGQASDSALNPDPVAVDGPIAASFTTDNPAGVLTNLSVLVSDTAGEGSFIVTIEPSVSLGVPDLNLSDAIFSSGSISDNLVSPDANGYWALSFTPNVAITAGTQYWTVIRDAGGATATNVNWLYANVSDNAGTDSLPTEYFYTAGGPANVNGSNPYVMSVQDAPEPTTIAVLGASLAGLGLVRRRRAARAA